MIPKKATIIKRTEHFTFGQNVWVIKKAKKVIGYSHCRKNKWFGETFLVRDKDFQLGFNNTKQNEVYTLIPKRYEVKIDVINATVHNIAIFLYTRTGINGNQCNGKIGIQMAGDLIRSSVGKNINYEIKDHLNGIYELRTINDIHEFTDGEIWIGENRRDNGDDIYMDDKVSIKVRKLADIVGEESENMEENKKQTECSPENIYGIPQIIRQAFLSGCTTYLDKNLGYWETHAKLIPKLHEFYLKNKEVIDLYDRSVDQNKLSEIESKQQCFWQFEREFVFSEPVTEAESKNIIQLNDIANKLQSVKDKDALKKVVGNIFSYLYFKEDMEHRKENLESRNKQ